VYYWFMQRGRVVTSEYMVKWYLLVDALSRHRTDGALVRLVIPVAPGTTTAAADHELNAFASAIAERLTKYVPG
jgi:EpsI family protein